MEYRPINPPEPIECDACEGKGYHDESECCGAYIDEDMKICHSCKEHSDFMECEECNGTGTKAF